MEFTHDWSSNCDAWPASLEGLAGLGARALEIGAFEGRQTIALAWFLGPEGHVLTIDPFTCEGQHDDLIRNTDMQAVADRFFANTAELRRDGRITPVIGRSRDLLPLLRNGMFDVVYVDGDHTLDACLADLRAVARLVAAGGLVLIDDYAAPDYPGVRDAVDQWLDETAGDFEVVHADYQLHARRR